MAVGCCNLFTAYRKEVAFCHELVRLTYRCLARSPGRPPARPPVCPAARRPLDRLPVGFGLPIGDLLAIYWRSLLAI